MQIRLTGCDVVLLACLAGIVSCSPERVAAEGQGDSSGESGLATDSESEDGPIAETETETDSGDDDNSSSDGEATDDWCQETICERDEACLGGRCVAPRPTQACGDVELVAHAHAQLVANDRTPLRFADIDGLPGDELIAAEDGVLQVLRAGELLASATLPSIYLDTIHPLQIGDDQHIDLLAFSGHFSEGYTMLLSGDGAGQFVAAQTQLLDELSYPFPIDFDNDGDHDVLGHFQPVSTNLYRNDTGTFTLLSSFDFDASGLAVDFDLDGFVDDALINSFPSPSVLLGEGGQMVEAGSLPEPSGAQGRLLAADLDGDGWLDVLAVLNDGLRVGARIWWGQPGNTFAEPRDQLLVEAYDDVHDPNLDFVGVIDLDGAWPLELIVSGRIWVGYVRPAPAEQLPFGCFTQIYKPEWEIKWAPTLGDLEGDGAVEIAIRDDFDAEIYTVVGAP